MKIKKCLSMVTKASLGILALGFMAGCVYDPYPAGYYSSGPNYNYRCYNYPYAHCYYSSQYYYYGNTYRASPYYGNYYGGYSYVY